MLITYLCHIKYKLIPFFSQEIIHHGHQQCKQMHIMLFVFSHITRCFLHIFLYVPHTMHSVMFGNIRVNWRTLSLCKSELFGKKSKVFFLIYSNEA